MPYLRDRAIVLKKEPYREHDRRYYLYGREHGMLIAIARGASSKKSKQAGHLEPFSEVDVMIAKGAAQDKLAVARCLDSRPRAHDHAPLPAHGSRLAFYSIAGAFSDLMVKLTYPGIADERLFALVKELHASLDAAPPEPTSERGRLMLAAATLKLLDILGFAPVIRESEENTTPVVSLALVSFLRRAPLSDVWRLTGRTDVFRAASGFVDEALKATHLGSQPRHAEGIYAMLG
jgi:recombinational DNA repair protein (RecF pathway)